MNEENPFYKKLSWCITREGSKYPFRNDYTYKFSTSQFLEQIDDLSGMSSYTHNEIKQIVIDQLTDEFRKALNQVIFGDPAGKVYIEEIEKERLNEEKIKDEKKNVEFQQKELIWIQRLIGAFKNRRS